MAVLKYYHNEVNIMRRSGDSTEFNQMKKLELSNLNLFIEQKSDLHYLES